MHIRNCTIANITSYRDATTFEFTPSLNILIGPNGGGKTNAIQALWLPLQRYLFSQYQIRIDDPESKSIDQQDNIKNRYKQDLQAHDPRKPREFSVTLTTDAADADNIDLVKQHLDELKSEFLPQFFAAFDNFSDAHLDSIRNGCDATFAFNDEALVEPSGDSLEGSLLAYCRVINMITRTHNRDLASKFSNPIFFLQSLRQSTVGYSVGIAGVQFQSLHDNLNNIVSSGGSGISGLASQHFGILMQTAVDRSSRSSDIAQDLFDAEPDVKLFRHYLGVLGYEWNLVPQGNQFGNYISEYKKNGAVIEPNRFSSGEREIINFLDAIISTKVCNGIVLIDEPELHLHPRWQSILLDLIQEFSKDRNLQFIFSTHSPVFVTHDTIDAVTRIFMENGCSKHASIHASDSLPDKAHLVRMINSHNNERLFFADRVVLVEGIMDRLVFERLVKIVGDRFTRRITTEVIEVHGKHNFEPYKSVLNIVKMPYSVIADQDYVLNIGSDALKGLFSADYSGIDKKVLLDKRSDDASTLIAAIENSTASGDLSEVTEIINYIKKRKSRLRTDLSEEENLAFNEFIAGQASESTYILKNGEIEDYLPEGVNSTASLITLLEDPDWLKQTDKEAGDELLGFVGQILELSADDITNVRNDLLP